MSHKIFPMARQLEHFAWPGGYTLLYLVTTNEGYHDNVGTLCRDCAQEELARATVEHDPRITVRADAFVHWEGPDDYCEGCNAPLESEYGDPGASDDSDTTEGETAP